MRIANVINSEILGIEYGITEVVIQNVEQSVRLNVSVRVVTEKQYKRIQKQKGGKNVNKGLLSGFFGLLEKS